MSSINISVIVPVYNVEKYLARCIESILSQDYNSFEVILIDDGSYDKSGEICDTYAKSNSKVRVYHQNNEGVAVTRNTGIKKAIGRFVCFVDSDDMMLPRALSNLWQCVIQHPNVDIVCGQILFDDYLIAPSLSVPDYTESRGFIRSKNLWELLSFSACARLVSKDLIDNHKVYFCEGINCGEDPLWIFFLHKHIRSVAQCREPVYHYIANEASVMHQKDKTKHYLSMLKCAKIAICNYDQDGRKAELSYILDLLSASRCHNALGCSDKKAIATQVENLYKNINHIKKPIPVRFAIWRIMRIAEGKDNKCLDVISRVIKNMSFL